MKNAVNNIIFLLLTFMVRPVKSVHQELCVLEEHRLSVQSISVQITRIVVNDNTWCLKQ